MARYSFLVDIAAPREFLFDLWTDPDRAADWTLGLTRVTETIGLPGEAGSKFRAWYGSLDEKVEVMVADRPLYVRRKSTFGGIKVETAVAFEQIDNRTRVRQSWTARGIKSRLWARLLAIGEYRWSFRAELQRFARVAEREFEPHAMEADETRNLVPVMAPRAAAPEDRVEAPPLIRV